MLLKLTLEYDGTDFQGWARQPGLRTVEGAVSAAFDDVFPSWESLAVAGRTDTGVHATGQVVSVEVEGGPPVERAAAALNAELPADVAVTECVAAAPGFDARFSATARSYRYVVLTGSTRSPLRHRRALWWPRALDDGLLSASAASIVGVHDFTAFTPTETQHTSFRREVSAAAWSRLDDELHFTITADAFLRRMVRTLVGTMLEAIELGPLLAGRPRAEAGLTAPARGLVLEHVRYLDDDLADAFLGGTLDRPISHEEHVRVALVVLRRLGPVDGRLAVARGLQRLTLRLGVPDKYDDALTTRWLDRLEELRVAGATRSIDDVLRAQPDLLSHTIDT